MVLDRLVVIFAAFVAFLLAAFFIDFGVALVWALQAWILRS
jgi:hypothetical protein